MGFTKTVTTPAGFDATYFSIDQLKCVESARDAFMILKVYKDKASADAGKSGTEVGPVRFTADAFDAFFSKDALVASNMNPYAAAYAALGVVTAAFKAKQAIDAYAAALKANPPPNPAPTAPAALTDMQRMLTCGIVQIPIDPCYGGALVFDGSTLA